jgi:beta-glucosidase
MANAKHWVNNEIEEKRKEVSANVDERTRFELYYPPFQAAVSAGTTFCLL